MGGEREEKAAKGSGEGTELHLESTEWERVTPELKPATLKERELGKQT